MVLKFEDYIKEGLWSKGLERAKSGERRTEDKFNETDLEELKGGITREIIEDYNLVDTLEPYFDKIDETYQEPIAKYAKKYGTYTLGFDKDSKSVLPNFDYNFNIEDFKNVMVHVSYDNLKREFKVMCGNNKDEFDIIHTNFGEYLVGCITGTQLEVMQEDTELVIIGMKKDWDIFSKELYDFYYKSFKKNYKNSFSNMIEDIYPGNNEILNKFYLVGITYRYDTPKIIVAEDMTIEDEPICDKIINVVKKAYKDATDTNEGLWGKGLERAQSGERRTEDKFTEGDLSEFDMKPHLFMDKYISDSELFNFENEVDDTFSVPIIEWVKKHGTISLGFGARDRSELPDFDYKFYIPELKNVMVHVSYDDFDKEIKVMCGNDKDEFDIIDTSYGKYLVKTLKNTISRTLKNNPNLLVDNLKKNWKTLEPLLFDIVYNESYSSLQSNKKSRYSLPTISDILSGIDFYKESDELKKFYIDHINVSVPPFVKLLWGIDVDDKLAINKKIINTCKNAYNKANMDTEQFDRYK